MAIYTHPDGYLQITEGHNWQDVSDDGILQRIFRGWNERRMVAGLPLYWYGTHPDHPGVVGDAGFAMIGNPLIETGGLYTLDDCRIYPGAVLQNVAFWNFIWNDLRNIVEGQYDAMNFVNWIQFEYDGNYQGQDYINIDANLYLEALGENTSAGDVLAFRQINNLLKAMHYLQFYWFNTFFGAFFDGTETGGHVPVGVVVLKSGSGSSRSCQTASQESSSLFNQVQSRRDGDWIYSSTARHNVYVRNPGTEFEYTDYSFTDFAQIMETGIDQYAFPIKGNTHIVATLFGGEQGTAPFRSLIPTAPTPGSWTIEIKDMTQPFSLPPNYLGFDPNTKPTVLQGFVCGNPGDATFAARVERFIKPQFADLPTP